MAASGLATIPLQKSRGFSLRRPQKIASRQRFLGSPQSRRKLAATTAASRRSRAISRPQRPRDTKVANCRWPPSSGDARKIPEKQTVGTVTASCKMLTLQALSSKLNAGTGKGGAAWAEERLLGALRQSVPQTGRPFLNYRVYTPSTAGPDPPTLAFLEKARVFPQKRKGSSLRGEPLKSLEKEGKRTKKARKIGKRKKQGNRKKQGLEGQGGPSGRNSGKIPERPRKHSESVSWNSPRQYGWDAPNPII